ncbi:MAG: hypothetical protein KA712_16545 [Myxococcales bacterium]|nr:hypothetical protein [Myxococcales bacterium]
MLTLPIRLITTHKLRLVPWLMASAIPRLPASRHAPPPRARGTSLLWDSVFASLPGHLSLLLAFGGLGPQTPPPRIDKRPKLS